MLRTSLVPEEDSSKEGEESQDGRRGRVGSRVGESATRRRAHGRGGLYNSQRYSQDR